MDKEYTISFVDNKSADWKILTLEIVEGDGSVMFQDVSVNRVNKNNETFPNFDGLVVGSRVRGNLWTSSGGKKYLYAPRPQNTNGGSNRGQSGGIRAGMQKMVEQKQEGIKQAQETKHEAIKEAGAQRDAVLIVTTFYPELANDPLISAEKEKLIKEKYLMWRDMFLNQEPFSDKQI